MNQARIILPRVLTIAGSDSGGGAGIQADLKTFQALGCYGMSALTALTAQNTVKVGSIYPVSAAFVDDQISMVMDDIGVDVIKIGMLFSAEIIEVVAKALRRYQPKYVVLDPVMVASSGDTLLKSEAVEALISLLLPCVSLITPNIPEAEVLVGHVIKDRRDMEAAAAILLNHVNHVVLKGGHLVSDASMSPDLFSSLSHSCLWIESPRLETSNTHGTGCTFSAAIAAFAAHGFKWQDAVLRARKYLEGAMKSGMDMEIGHGRGPVDHGWQRIGETK